MMKCNLPIMVILLVAFLAITSGSLVADPRTGEEIQNVTFSVASGSGNSANYGASVVVGQASMGTCASANFGVNQGFWLIIPRGGGGGGCCNTPGDANDDGSANVGDAVYLIGYVFKGGPAPPCMAEGDANCDTQTNVGDAVYLISFVFKGGPAPCCP